MKTKGMKHQLEGLKRLRAAPRYFAVGSEQGTGKTWMLLADAEKQFKAGEIAALFVIAPKGVHTNWILREIPKHVSVKASAMAWKSGAGKKYTKQLESQLNPKGDLVVHAMNVDAVNTKSGFEYAKRFLNAHRSMMIVDESQRIKNPAAQRTRRIIELGHLATSRRISSGTLVSNSPMDLFSQYDFLHPGLLGTTSYRAFISEYAEVLPPSNPLVQEIIARTRSRGTPQIIAKDNHGNPKYRNLAKLSSFMSPHTFRVLKSECLDLPEKIYKTQFFELSPAQRSVYDGIESDMRFEYNDEIDTFTALTVINKLRTATSGFVLVGGEPVLTGGKERMDALLEIVEDLDGQFIVWATFREEIRQIASALKSLGCVEYHGRTSNKDRERAIDSFQHGEARVFIGNPQAAGTGLTLHAAETAIYFSSSFSLEERMQSEDRCHRIGLKHPVVYIDIAAIDTIDERIAAALQSKRGTAAEILDNIL